MYVVQGGALELKRCQKQKHDTPNDASFLNVLTLFLNPQMTNWLEQERENSE